MTLLGVLSWILLGAAVAGAAYQLVAAYATRRFVRRRWPRPQEPAGVTALKPLHGAEPHLAVNLFSLLDQEHAPLQVVFGIQRPDDPAIPVVEAVVQACPTADVTLVVDATRDGRNPKVANLLNMAPAIRHPIVVIADDDMAVPPHYVAALVGELERPGVGLVTCLYRGIAADGTLASRLGAAQINHGFLPSVLVADLLGARQGCFGATMALSAETLARIGGLERLKDELADDYVLGEAVRKAGLKLALSPVIVTNMVTEKGLSGLFRHELRWARTMRAVAPLDYPASIVTHTLCLAALGAAAAGFSPAALAVLAGAGLARVLMVRVTAHALRVPATPLWLVPLRDLVSFGVILASFVASRVEWRGETLGVGRAGRLGPEVAASGVEPPDGEKRA
ncbi:bacteriohopanetetrol glucosamine biosynthesis glycosyltransferase HpnI [Zavarzinia sp. CC-PAN008]|uniref:bacteriohopanetetrol glucosamine biosynthesis glycosyltransferase HpnI n=1 Tax=Zavarzinia sp. CC-PAN008 TaxID=3243332 RepID=UPI003F74ABA6